MAEILAKHAKAKVSVNGSASVGYPETPGIAEVIQPELRPAAAALVWVKVPDPNFASGFTPYAIRTADGKMTITKSIVKGEELFQIWRLTPGSEWFTTVGPVFTSATKAKDYANTVPRI